MSSFGSFVVLRMVPAASICHTIVNIVMLRRMTPNPPAGKRDAKTNRLKCGWSETYLLTDLEIGSHQDAIASAATVRYSGGQCTGRVTYLIDVLKSHAETT